MAARTLVRRTASSTVAALSRHHGPDAEVVTQARRALEVARTEDLIREAIETAPPLDPDTLARIRSLIPAVPSDEREAAA